MANLTTRDSAPQNQGILMSTMARKVFAHPSAARGVTGNTGATATYSPGGVLGTGDNVDLYTPGPEAV